MSGTVEIIPLGPEVFAPFGDVLDCAGEADLLINQGLCERFHDRANLEFAEGGRAGLSLFRSRNRALPYALDMMERHPLGSQAFVPMSMDPFLVIVAPDEGGRPGRPIALRSAPGQGINFARNTWHGVLTPLAGPGLFVVIDRIGEGNNLEEVWFETPWQVIERP
jgi:ureidoglycolate lyase